MADLTEWTGPLDLGPFRLGLRPQREIDLTALTDAELSERVRELFPKLVNSWRIDGTQEDALLLIRGLEHHPDLVALLSDQEAHDLGV